MEKPLLTALLGPSVGRDGASGDLQSRANSFSQVDGVSDMVPACQLCGFVGKGSEKGRWPLATFLCGRKLFPNSYLNVRHFSFSLYAIGAFQAATLMLELRGSESE